MLSALAPLVRQKQQAGIQHISSSHYSCWFSFHKSSIYRSLMFSDVTSCLLGTALDVAIFAEHISCGSDTSRKMRDFVTFKNDKSKLKKSWCNHFVRTIFSWRSRLKGRILAFLHGITESVVLHLLYPVELTLFLLIYSKSVLWGSLLYFLQNLVLLTGPCMSAFSWAGDWGPLEVGGHHNPGEQRLLHRHLRHVEPLRLCLDVPVRTIAQELWGRPVEW